MKFILTESQFNGYMRFLAESRVRAASDGAAAKPKAKSKKATKGSAPVNRYEQYVKNVTEDDIPAGLQPWYRLACAAAEQIKAFQKDHEFADEDGIQYKLEYSVRPSTGGFIFLRKKTSFRPWAWGKDRWAVEDPIRILVKDKDSASERVKALRQIIKADKSSMSTIGQKDTTTNVKKVQVNPEKTKLPDAGPMAPGFMRRPVNYASQSDRIPDWKKGSSLLEHAEAALAEILKGI